MTDEILCPSCGTDDHITGEPHDGLIHLTCSVCDVEWDRDPSPRCPTCDNTEVEGVAKAVWDKSRGTQLSVSYIKIVYLCTTCDRELLRRQRQSRSPLPPDEHPATSG